MPIFTPTSNASKNFFIRFVASYYHALAELFLKFLKTLLKPSAAKKLSLTIIDFLLLHLTLYQSIFLDHFCRFILYRYNAALMRATEAIRVSLECFVKHIQKLEEKLRKIPVNGRKNDVHVFEIDDEGDSEGDVRSAIDEEGSLENQINRKSH